MTGLPIQFAEDQVRLSLESNVAECTGCEAALIAGQTYELQGQLFCPACAALTAIHTLDPDGDVVSLEAVAEAGKVLEDAAKWLRVERLAQLAKRGGRP